MQFAINSSLNFQERNLNPKAACLKRREEEKVDDELPEKRLAPNDLDKAFDHVGLSPGGGPMRGGGNRARRGRRSSRGKKFTDTLTLLFILF